MAAGGSDVLGDGMLVGSCFVLVAMSDGMAEMSEPTYKIFNFLKTELLAHTFGEAFNRNPWLL